MNNWGWNNMEANLIILPKNTEKNTLDRGFKSRVRRTLGELTIIYQMRYYLDTANTDIYRTL